MSTKKPPRGRQTISPRDPGTASARARSWTLALAALFVIAAAWRLAYLARLWKSPLAVAMFDDARIYWAWSERIAAGKLLGEHAFFLAPLYPYLVGLLRALGIGSPAAILTVQVLWGAAAAVLLADAARRLTTPAIGIAMGGLVGLYEMAVFFDGLFLTESLLFFLGSLLLWWVVRCEWRAPRWPAALGLGLLVGLLAAGRATAALLLLPAVLMLRRRASSVVAVIGGFVLIVLPMAAHNFVVAREWIPFTYNSGLNLYVGNNPKATGVYVPIAGAITGQPSGLDGGVELDGREYLQGIEGTPLTPSASSARWAARAREYAWRHPGRTARLAFTKLAMLWNAREYPQIENVEEYRAFVGPIGLPLVGTFSFLGVLALAGVGFAWSVGDRGRFLLGYVMMLSLATLPFFVTDRYRHQLIPACALLAALAVHRLWTAGRQRGGRWRGLAPLLAGLALVHLPVPGPTREQQAALLAKNTGARLFHAGWTAAQAGRVDEAERAFAQAVQADPRLHQAWGALIRAEVQAGRIDEAQQTFEKARAAGLPELATHLYAALFAALANHADTAERELRQVPDEALRDPSLSDVVQVTRRMISSARARGRGR